MRTKFIHQIRRADSVAEYEATRGGRVVGERIFRNSFTAGAFKWFRAYAAANGFFAKDRINDTSIARYHYAKEATTLELR